MYMMWITTVALVSLECVTWKKIHAAQAWTPEEPSSKFFILENPFELLYKSLLVLYLINSAAGVDDLQQQQPQTFAHHMTEDDVEGHDEGKLGGGDLE